MHIRKILDILSENSAESKHEDDDASDLSDNLHVMSLEQFVDQAEEEDTALDDTDDIEDIEDIGSIYAPHRQTKNVSESALPKIYEKWYNKYKENEANNMHSENVLHIAKLIGTDQDVALAKDIVRTHKKEGHLSANNGARRKELFARLVPQLKRFMEYYGLNEAKLGGVTARKFDEPELTDYMDRILGKQKDKLDKYKRPYIHSGNIIPIVNLDTGKKYDLDKLRAAFTERPAKILKQNEKMQHSDGSSSIFYNVGLPALKGLAVDEETGDFIVIDTCPGAGACKTFCYAMKGGYVQWKASSLSSTKLLNFLYNDPEGFMAQLSDEIESAQKKYGKKGTKVVIRWHDAGDFFSPQYLELAYEVAKNNPDVDFYAYTKLASVAKADRPDNFKINFSSGAQGREEKQIDFGKDKFSKVVPKELFKDVLEKDDTGKWQYISDQALEALKQRLAAKYSIDASSLLTYDEMMAMGKDTGEKNKYNVIVKPGDGDDAANRNDVLGSYLLIH